MFEENNAHLVISAMPARGEPPHQSPAAAADVSLGRYHRRGTELIAFVKSNRHGPGAADGPPGDDRLGGGVADSLVVVAGRLA